MDLHRVHAKHGLRSESLFSHLPPCSPWILLAENVNRHTCYIAAARSSISIRAHSTHITHQHRSGAVSRRLSFSVRQRVGLVPDTPASSPLCLCSRVPA